MVFSAEQRRSLNLVTAPDFDPTTAAKCLATLGDLKRHCFVDFIDDDEILKSLGAVAFAKVDGLDGVLGRALLPQTWELKLDRFAVPGFRDGGRIPLPLPPVQSLASIKYVDAAGAVQEMDSGDYQLVKNGTRSSFVAPSYGKCWPSARSQYDAVTIQFVAGYEDGTKVPAPIAHANKILVKHWYDNRDLVASADSGGVREIPTSAEALLVPYITGWF